MNRTHDYQKENKIAHTVCLTMSATVQNITQGHNWYNKTVNETVMI